MRNMLRFDDVAEALRDECSCGGGGPEDPICDVCKVYHRVKALPRWASAAYGGVRRDDDSLTMDGEEAKA